MALCKCEESNACCRFCNGHCNSYATTGDPPERLRPLFTKIDAMLTARIAMWDARRAAAAEADPAKHDALLERYTQAMMHATELTRDFTAEMRRLGQ